MTYPRTASSSDLATMNVSPHPDLRVVPFVETEAVPSTRGKGLMPGGALLKRLDSVHFRPPTDRIVTQLRKFKIGRLAAFVLIVLLPTLASLAYALTTTSPLYESNVSFAIRARDGQTSLGFGGIAANLGIGLSGTNDIYAVRSHLESGETFIRVDKEVDYLKHVSDGKYDWLMRLPTDSSFDEQLEYFRQHVKVRLSTMEQIVTVDVDAFEPAFAQRLAGVLVQISEEFINKLNERAKLDFVDFAQREVSQAEIRVSETRLAITDWRNENSLVDPSKTVDAQLSIIAGMEASLANVRADISQIQDGGRDVAPRFRVLKEREQALMKQIDEVRSGIAGQNSQMSKYLSDYERLQIELELAEKGYAAAIESLKAARQEATQQQKYIVITSSPSLTEDPVFPRPLFHTMIVFMSALALYLVAIFLSTLTRDYISTS